MTISLFGTNGYGNAVSLTTTTASDGTYSFTNLIPGSYTVCETIPSGFAQTFPASGADCSAHGGGTGYSITLQSGDSDTGNDFGNTPLHRIIVLTCHQATNTLVGSTVTIGAESHTSDTAVPAALLAKGVTQADLCTLGGAQFDNKPHGSQTATVSIPSSGSGSGH